MNNIAEGFERNSDAEFARFLQIAKGSAGEVRSMLHLGRDIGYFDEEVFLLLNGRAEETMRVIVGLKTSIDARLRREKAR